MNDLRVTPDGYVTIGSANDWYSFEQIQNAVLEAQNPALRSVGTKQGGTIGLNVKPVKPKAPVQLNAKSSNEQEALPLPSTLVQNEEKQTTNEAGCDCEHLPLPSTYRRTK